MISKDLHKIKYLQSLILLFFIVLSSAGCEVIKSVFDENTNAIITAKYTVMKKYLKNPDSARFDNERVHDKYKFDLEEEGKSIPSTKFIISFDVNAENSFGGKVLTGYCLALTTTKDSRYIVDVPPQECTRGGPTADEIITLKALAQWKN